MTPTQQPTPGSARRRLVRALMIVTATLSSATLVFGSQAQFYVRPHWPRATALAGVDAITLAHMGLALLALVAGAVQLLSPKGTTLHRYLGWGWAITMFVVAGLALFIPVTGRPYPPPYIFLVIAIVGVPAGVAAARLGRIELHRAIMTLVFAGCLLAGLLFAFMPLRLVWRVFFG